MHKKSDKKLSKHNFKMALFQRRNFKEELIMKTLTKAAISAAAVMAITTGALALTASAAIDPRRAELPQGTYSARSNDLVVNDTTSSIPRYSQKGKTSTGENFNCKNSNQTTLTTNSVTRGITSSMTAQSGYTNNYKWCSVYLQDTDGNHCTALSFDSSNPNDTTVSATNYEAATQLNGTYVNGYYVFSIRESNNEFSDYLSQVYLDVNVNGV